MLCREGCQARRERLLHWMDQERLDGIALTDRRDVYYLAGEMFPDGMPVLLLLQCDGTSWLFTGQPPESAWVDRWVGYEWQVNGTQRCDPMCQLAVAVSAELWAEERLGRIGWQIESISRTLSDELDPIEWVGIDKRLRTLQRKKDEDELELIRGSIEANCGAYDAVRRLIQPGATELEVLAAGIRGAMTTAGEKVYHDGDYRCGAYNGPARQRQIESGELYIVDAWTCRRGYWADMCRTFTVGQHPTDLQISIFEHIAAVQEQAAAMLRPGITGGELWLAMDQLIREHPALTDSGLVHHGGHGIGLRIHEPPDINCSSGDRVEVGDVVCLEPGGYTPAARYGVRIENMYRVTESGAECLSPHPPASWQQRSIGQSNSDAAWTTTRMGRDKP